MTVISPASLRKELLGLLSLQTLKRRGFFRNVLLVMTGTGVAQLVTVLLSPVLSRLYDPGDFGIYGSFYSVVAILVSVLSLQYSDALMLPSTEDESARLLVAACSAAFILSIAAMGLTLLFPELLIAVLSAPELRNWLWLVPLAALMGSVNQSLTSWCARRKAFSRTAAVQVVRSVSSGSAQAGAGALKYAAGGLIAGNLVGELLAAATLWRWVLRKDLQLLRNAFSASKVYSAAKAFRDFPLFSTPQSFLNALSQGAPVLLLIHYYGATFGGLYAFSVRVLQMPMNFFLTSLRQVLNQKLNEVNNSGGVLEPLFAKCTAMLFAAAAGPCLLGIVIAPPVFEVVFGKEWRTAGECARWLLLWFLPMFCNVPAVLLGRALRQQRNLLLFDLGLTVSRLTALIAGGMFLTFMQTIALFSIVGAVFNCVLIGFIWRLVRKKDQLVRAQP